MSASVQALLTALGGASALVSSVQQVSITIAAGQTSGTATISAVNLSTASEHIGGSENDPVTTTNAATCRASFVLTGTTTVTATRNTSDASNALTITGTVIQWRSSAIASIQRGSATMTAAATATASLSAITTANAAIQYNGLTTTNTGTGLDVINAYVQITNTTTITATRTTGTNNMTVYFTVVEFSSGILNSSTQQVLTTIASATTSKTSTITGVTAAQTMVFWGGWTCGSASAFSSLYPWLTLTNGTTLTLTRASANSFTSINSCTVVEFKSTDIKSVNRGSIVIAVSSSSNTASISAVTTTKCIANWLGQTVAGTAADPAIVETNITLTNSTTVTASISGVATVAVTAGYEAIEWV